MVADGETLSPVFRFALDQVDDAVVLVNGEGEIVYYNTAAESLTGILRSEAIGRACRHVFGKANDEASCVFEDFSASDHDRFGSRTIIHRGDGHEVPVEMCLVRVPEQVGGALYYMGTIRDLSIVERLQSEMTQRHRFGDILARSPQMKRIFSLIESIADTDVGVLIQGESGTGKELVARAIHDRSLRSEGPFHAVNCGALTLELLDSEIFGHEKGAFTGAVKEKPGRLELARGGTLFLDEVGDMPMALQVKMLRVLQERTFERVGGTRTLSMDARIIAATNIDLEKAVGQGRFRQDLYFRLHVVPIRLPPLRERQGDTELIAEHYLRVLATKSGRASKRFAPETLRIMMDYPWPGNVRELINAIEYAVAVSPGDLILPPDLPEQFRRPVRWNLGEEPEAAASGPAATATASAPPAASPWPPGGAIDGERQAILDALAANRYRRADTARVLGMSRTTLWRKMRELGLV